MATLDEAPELCVCESDDFETVKFVRTGEEGRMCRVCGHIERRCPGAHWVEAKHIDDVGFCPPCRERRERYGVNGF